MCQLTLLNLNNLVLTRLALFSHGYTNASGNPDGFGFFQPGGKVFKTKLSANGITNIGLIITQEILTTKPVMAHVRLASKGVVVTKENAHPFELDNLIGIHNGTLYFEGEVATSPYNTVVESRPSDSLRFLTMLDKELETVSEFVTAFNNCMGKCRGKFAMIIWSKLDQKMYVCVGKTASLYKSDVFGSYNETTKTYKDWVGFVVNTKSDSLIDGELVVSNTLQLFTQDVRAVYSQPIALADETIFVVEGSELKEIGKTKENPLVVPTTSAFHGTVVETGKSSFTTRVVDKPDYIANYEIIADWMEEESLSIDDIDALFEILFGHGLLAASRADVSLFVEYFTLCMSSRPAIADALVMNKVPHIPNNFYRKNGLQFPLGSPANKVGETIQAIGDIWK